MGPRIRRAAVLIAALCLAGHALEAAPLPTGQRACVVLLHGLGRSSWSMFRLAAAAEDAGYVVANIDYPSQSQPIEVLAATAVPEGLRQCRAAGATPVHFVTHSMGGIVLRQYLAGSMPEDLGRVVMLSPPNQGSELADALGDEAIYQWINGPAGGQLGVNGITARLGAVTYPVGILTGNAPSVIDNLLPRSIPGEHDGKVSVESAKVAGMADFLVLPVGHTFIVMDDAAIAQTLHFLAHGRFRRDGAAGAR